MLEQYLMIEKDYLEKNERTYENKSTKEVLHTLHWVTNNLNLYMNLNKKMRKRINIVRDKSEESNKKESVNKVL